MKNAVTSDSVEAAVESLVDSFGVLHGMTVKLSEMLKSVVLMKASHLASERDGVEEEPMEWAIAAVDRMAKSLDGVADSDFDRLDVWITVMNEAAARVVQISQKGVSDEL